MHSVAEILIRDSVSEEFGQGPRREEPCIIGFAEFAHLRALLDVGRRWRFLPFERRPDDFGITYQGCRRIDERDGSVFEGEDLYPAILSGSRTVSVCR